MRREPWRTRSIAAVLVLGTFALYAQVLSHPFIYFDDNRYVTENPVVQRGLSWAGLAWAFTSLHASNWHPLTWLSHMADVELFGLHAGAHHGVNAALHALNAALLFFALSRVSGAVWRSAVVAALFATHPLHVESVAWVAERKDLLSTLFGLLAIWAYARHAEKPGPRRYWLVAAFFAASLLSKPMWVTLPFVLLLLDAWPLERVASDWLPPPEVRPFRPRLPLGRLLAEKLPLIALAVASCVVTVLAQGRGGALTGLELGLGPRLANGVVGYARYLGKTLWPSELAVYYPYPQDALTWLQVGGAVVALAAISAGAVREIRRSPWLAVGWAWFLGMLVPVIGLVQVGSQAMADRYTYVPIVGLFIAGTWGAHRWFGGWRGGVPLCGAAAALVLVLGALSFRQLDYWGDHDRLFRHALAAGGESGLVHGVLSEGLRQAGKLDEALVEARLATQLSPGTARHWNNLAISFRDLGHLPEARDALERAVQLDSAYAIAWANLADLELRLGRPGEAVKAGVQATKLGPGEATSWYRLGAAHAAIGQAASAISEFREAVRLKPDHAAAWNSLGALLQGSGRSAEAAEAFQAAVRAQPGNAVTWRNLGVYYAKNGRFSEASQALREAMRLDPGNADILYRLGRAEVDQGHRTEALEIAAQLQVVDPRRAAELRGSAGAVP